MCSGPGLPLYTLMDNRGSGVGAYVHEMVVYLLLCIYDNISQFNVNCPVHFNIKTDLPAVPSCLHIVPFYLIGKVRICLSEVDKLN